MTEPFARPSYVAQRQKMALRVPAGKETVCEQWRPRSSCASCLSIYWHYRVIALTANIVPYRIIKGRELQKQDLGCVQKCGLPAFVFALDPCSYWCSSSGTRIQGKPIRYHFALLNAVLVNVFLSFIFYQSEGKCVQRQKSAKYTGTPLLSCDVFC